MNTYDAWHRWAAGANGLPPIGAVLRAQLQERALRMEERPRSDDAEHDVRVERHRHLAWSSAVLGLGSSCLVLATTWNEEDHFSRWPECAVPLGLLEKHGYADRESRTHYEIITWGDTRDTMSIIECMLWGDYEGCVVVLSEATGGIYCPDQHGADFVLRDPATLPLMRTLFGGG